jgi:addiction module RelB/DinJ family antitoxin
MKGSVIRARVDDLLKAQASAVLASCGLEMSDALRLFLIQVVNQGGLPFPVRQVARHASTKKLKQMKRKLQARDRALVAQGGAAVPADRIAIEQFQTKRGPQINATAQDLKKAPEA